jgi:general secretion pathway protein C
MLARLSAFVIWAVVAATAVFWGLRLLVRAPAAPAYAVAVGDAAAVRGDLTRLLGTAPVAPPTEQAAPEAASRFRLLGIVAPKQALIAVDGKMPKAYTIGAPLDGNLVLQSVSLRTASIGSGQGAPTITLELPRAATAATGSLPAAPIGGSPANPMPSGAMPPQYVPQQQIAPQQQIVPQAVPPLVAPPPGQAPNPPRTDSGAPTQ